MTPGGGAALGLPLGSLVTSDPSNSSLWAGSCMLMRPEVDRVGRGACADLHSQTAQL